MLWATEAKDGSGFGIFGQILAPDNTRVGAEFRINIQTEGHQTHPHVKGLPGGGFVAAWVEEGRGIVLRSFGADGSPVGPETTLGTPTVFGTHITSGSSAPSFAVQQDGSVGLVWIDRAIDGSTPPSMKLAIFGADGQQRDAVIDVPTNMTQFTLPEARIRTEGDQGFAVIGYRDDNSEGTFHGWTVAANGTMFAPIQTNGMGWGLGAYSLVETPTTLSGRQFSSVKMTGPPITEPTTRSTYKPMAGYPLGIGLAPSKTGFPIPTCPAPPASGTLVPVCGA